MCEAADLTEVLGGLATIECLSNTVRLDTGTDTLADLPGLARWLASHATVLDLRELDPADLDSGGAGSGSGGSGGALLGVLGQRSTEPHHLGPADLDLVRRFRGVVRDLLDAGTDGEAAVPARRALDELAVETGVGVRFDPEGPVHRSDRPGVAGIVGDLVGVVAAAMEDGSWSRLKPCDDPTCRWVYYDRSRNRSGRWCSMEVCGNRAKVRTYRERHAPA